MKTLKSIITISAFLSTLLVVSCSKNSEELVDTPPQTVTPPNILLIIADDLGKDAISGFSEGTIKPNTPHIDAIRENGLSFNNFWVNPTCSPTRASIITGKYGFRTNVKDVGDILSTSEITLQKYIGDKTNNSYATALIGKWHLSGNNSSVTPESFGIDYFAGIIRGAVDDYYRWQLSEDGSSSLQTTYATEKLTDLSIDWINQQSKSWFLWLAYNAPHTPFHVPPTNTHSQGNLTAYVNGMNAIPYYMAAIESMDYHIGRLLDNIPEAERNNTIIIFIGDNGTPNQVAQSPYTSSTVKNTLYQGGINTPMFISGKGVSRIGTDNNLITSTDLFATIAEIAGISTPQIYDSTSFSLLFTQSTTLRNFEYSEMNDEWAIRNNTYKLVVNANGNSRMYHLIDDPYEQNNLLNTTLSSNATSAKLELETELNNIRQ